MGTISGDLKSLRASERSALEKLSSQKSLSNALVSADLARRAAKLVARLGLQIGLLIGRDGRVEYAILGSRDRIYLPDLGRFRLDRARLRRLRLIVFLPEGQHRLRYFAGEDSSGAKISGPTKILAPEIAPDLLTDLEKLRLDAVAVIAVAENAALGAISLVSIAASSKQFSSKFSASPAPTAKPVNFIRHPDFNAFELDFERFISDLESSITSVQERTYATGKDPAVLVGVYTGSAAEAEASMTELLELARTAEIKVLDTVIQRRRALDPKTVVGKGKLEEIVLHCLDLGADLLVFDRELSPGQLRSITNLTELRIIDRSMLILDIFAQRAKSSEGRLQVELAQLRYTLPRLTEKDTGLSRLSGGIGGRGPGETKLEISRRRIRDRLADLEKRIERLATQRGVRRELRQSRGVPVVAIVGYTNAGKSTLLNTLTKGDVLAESKLFATLDPSSRRMRFPNDREVVFVDTVGFIRELPEELVSAFRATLEEVKEADLLLHLVDAGNRELREQIKVVENTLSSLGFADKPKILVLNKTDLLTPLEITSLENSLGAISISALTRGGLELLVSELQRQLQLTFSGRDPGRFTEYPSYGEME